MTCGPLVLYATQIKFGRDPAGQLSLRKNLCLLFQEGARQYSHHPFLFIPIRFDSQSSTDWTLAGYIVLASAEIAPAIGAIGRACISQCSSATAGTITTISLVQGNIQLQGWWHDCF
jgi:hypothetical protein